MMNSMENSGYKVFLELQHRNNGDQEYVSVESVPFSGNHKIGASTDGYPLFFIKCDNLTNSIDINLELISVLFSQECSIRENENNSSEIFTIVLLKTLNKDLQQYFTDVFSIILQQIDSIPTERDLYREVRKVIELFSSITKPAVKSLQGLWGELLVIEKSLDPEYLINSWHISPFDKFDFNDGKDKLEIKSTTKSKRIHRFSIEQLNNNPSSNLLIGSVFVIETGMGISILNIRDMIVAKITNINVQLRMNEIIYKTVGNEYEKLGDVFFDYQQASDTLSFYKVADIPNIHSNAIPIQISNITFDCDLSNIPSVIEQSLEIHDSLLFKSLGL
ncbi:PD-(D/E)XK motif protein [Flavobacterium piscis]|nr:PD-(D/E)XK motif protein [Flavobacterium piscis]